eukprot:GHVP01055544.1.p1 GENE.GHVP01055544.1~~GHVP01055544.1.p1  ORF type:complete len:251 (-),score=43.87 GHVP01055544.1:195-947(-)
MEFKLLSDQLTSAFEVVNTPQRNICANQDDLLLENDLMEPAFRGIKEFGVMQERETSTGDFEYWYYFADRVRDWKKKDWEITLEKRISNILNQEGSECYLFEVEQLRKDNFDDSGSFDYIGFEDPDNFGQSAETNPKEWEIMECRCRNPKRERHKLMREPSSTMLMDTCGCRTFRVSIKSNLLKHRADEAAKILCDLFLTSERKYERVTYSKKAMSKNVQKEKDSIPISTDQKSSDREEGEFLCVRDDRF